jgi:hypothetical protein
VKNSDALIDPLANINPRLAKKVERSIDSMFFTYSTETLEEKKDEQADQLQVTIDSNQLEKFDVQG